MGLSASQEGVLVGLSASQKGSQQVLVSVRRGLSGS